MLAARSVNAALLVGRFASQLEGFRLVLFRWPDPSLQVIRSVIGSPIAEELLFRGWLMCWLKEKDLAGVAVGKSHMDTPNLLTSLCFAVTHLFNGGSAVQRILNLTFGLLDFSVSWEGEGQVRRNPDTRAVPRGDQLLQLGRACARSLVVTFGA